MAESEDWVELSKGFGTANASKTKRRTFTLFASYFGKLSIDYRTERNFEDWASHIKRISHEESKLNLGNQKNIFIVGLLLSLVGLISAAICLFNHISIGSIAGMVILSAGLVFATYGLLEAEEKLATASNEEAEEPTEPPSAPSTAEKAAAQPRARVRYPW